MRTAPRPVDIAPRNPVRAWSQTGRAAGYIAGFAVLSCGLVALGRLCGKDRIFPASLGALAYLEALLLLGIAVTGLIPYDAGYN